MYVDVSCIVKLPQIITEWSASQRVNSGHFPLNTVCPSMKDLPSLYIELVLDVHDASLSNSRDRMFPSCHKPSCYPTSYTVGLHKFPLADPPTLPEIDVWKGQ